MICAGTNHIPENPYQSPFEIADKILDMIRETRHLMPDTKIYLQSILPKFDDSYTTGIARINSHLAQQQKRLDFTLLPNWKFFKNQKMNTELFSKDRLHLNFKGVRTLAINYMFRHDQ